MMVLTGTGATRIAFLISSIYVRCQALSFRDDGTFKIVQFTDMHYGEGTDNDILTNQLQASVIEAEQPDLVVFSGDAVSGYAWDGSEGWYEEQWNMFTIPVKNASVPYAYTLGNHDAQGDLDREAIITLDMTNAPLSLTKLGPSTAEGASNFVLEIEASSNVSDGRMTERPSAYLWFFDSEMENCLDVTGWGCVYPSAIEWYRQTSASLNEKNGGMVVPGVGFYHIPVPEMMNLFSSSSFSTYGEKREDICCFSVNTGLFASIEEQKNLRFITCGHDHDNDFYGDYNGVTLAYGRKTGHGGYGPPVGMQRGARVIELTETTDGSSWNLSTWIRQEDGQKVIQESSLRNQQQSLCCGTEGASVSKCTVFEAEFREQLALDENTGD